MKTLGLLLALPLLPALPAAAAGTDDSALASALRDCLGTRAKDEPYASWFEKDGLSAEGRRSLKTADLSCGRGAAAGAAPAPRRSFILDDRVYTFGGAPDFDGASGPASAEVPAAPSRPLRLSLSWGTAPRAAVHARNLDSLYTLAGRGGEALVGLAAGSDPGSGGAIAGRTLKMAFLDAPLAYVLMIAGHEAGHLETAYMYGGRDLGWVPEGKWTERALGHSYSVGDRSGVTPSENQAIVAAGIQASQTAAAELRRAYLSRDMVDWTFFPQWLANKSDLTGYVLAAPKPSKASAEGLGRDPVQYSLSYGARAGKNPDAVSKSMVGGAIWNALDPINAVALYSYLVKHVVDGEGAVPNPMPRVAGIQYGASTGYWFTEVGPQYLLTLMSRDPKNGNTLDVTPSLGEDGQWGVKLQAGGVRFLKILEAGLGVEAWRQRAAAEPGGKSWGGAVNAELGVEILKGARIKGEAGVKSRGATLGKPFEPGFSAIGGLHFDL